MEKLKILVVDDESRMRKLVKDFLVKAGYDVIEAGDGEQAVDTFYAQKDIALIILDVMMPKMDGWQVCREIRQNSKVPIIMLTAKSEERDELGLPVTLAELGAGNVTDDQLMEVAKTACAETDTLHNMPFEVTPETVFAAIKAADAYGRYYLDEEE